MTLRFTAVRDRHLRRVLIQDYLELGRAIEHHMDTTTLFLAGAIVEAVLIDFLLVIEYRHKPALDPKRKRLSDALDLCEAQVSRSAETSELCEALTAAFGKPSKPVDPKNMQFSDLISACLVEGALTPTTATLCQGLKNYRNLIHPGRSARTKESADASRAAVADKLVERVVGEVFSVASGRPEWAAEAVLAFADQPFVSDVAIERKVNSLDMNEVERLVVQVLPDHFQSGMWGWNTPCFDEPERSVFMSACRTCMRFGLKVVPLEVKTQVGAWLLEHVDSSGATRDEWVETFFFSELLDALESPGRQYLTRHVLEELPSMLKQGYNPDLDEIGRHLEPSDAIALVKAMARAVMSKDERMQEYGIRTLLAEIPELQGESGNAARSAVDKAITDCIAHQSSQAASRLSDLRYAVWPLEDEDIPR